MSSKWPQYLTSSNDKPYTIQYHTMNLNFHFTLINTMLYGNRIPVSRFSRVHHLTEWPQVFHFIFSSPFFFTFIYEFLGNKDVYGSNHSKNFIFRLRSITHFFVNFLKRTLICFFIGSFPSFQVQFSPFFTTEFKVS